jgi:hypothetical protein
MVLAGSHRLPLIPWYLGTLIREPLQFRLQDFHLLWFVVPNDSAIIMVFYSPSYLRFRPQAPHNTPDTTVVSLNVSESLGCSAFARHYWRNRYYFFFLGVLRYFTSPRLLYYTYEFSVEFSGITLRGLPHSEIIGSQVVSTYPMLIAGNHVLHRLLVPRHPPYALCNLTKNLYRFTCISPVSKITGWTGF